MRSSWSRYRLEMAAIGVATIGLLLLVIEPRGLLQNSAELLANPQSMLAAAVDWVEAWLQARLAGVNRSDLAGAILLAATGLFFLLRARWYFIRAPRWTRRVCPRCGGQLARVHRTTLDRVLGALLFLPLRRYRCHNHECRWESLRIGKGRHHRQLHERRER